MKNVLIIVGVMLDLTHTAMAQTHFGQPDSSRITSKPLMVKEIMQEVDETHDVLAKENLLKEAAKARSGLAYLQLGQLALNQSLHSGGNVSLDTAKDILNDFKQAVRFGHLEGYLGMATLYDKGLGVTQNSFLAGCYNNLAKLNPDQRYIDLCNSRMAQDFVIVKPEGLQNTYEVNLKAQNLVSDFCQKGQGELLNARLSEQLRTALFQKICQTNNVVTDTQNKQNDFTLKNDDLILVDGALTVYKHGALTTYQLPLQKGQIVYQKNPEYSAYIFDGKDLRIANEGTVIQRGSKIYRIEQGQMKLGLNK
ncbi:hypothetical protein [Cysteiniphilum sp. 6C5]|uniref:hypothetical protein n=1 Tax=unclassified Cysteiniphilum TaxID=2610889 RepID=UPI003F87DE60